MSHEHASDTSLRRQRRCPRDGQPLRLEVTAGVPVDVCPECDGVWLDPGEIERLRPDFPLDALRAPARHGLRTYAVRPCPACRRGSLVPHYYGATVASRVEIDVCDRCGGLWLDLRAIRSRRSAPAEVRGADPRRAPGAGPGAVDGASVEAGDDAAVASARPAPSQTGMISLPRGPREWFVTLTGIPMELGNPCSIVPVATFALIGACVAMFLLQTTPAVGIDWIERFALTPERLADGEVFRLFTAVFLHGSWPHLLFNMFFLYTFGDNLEERFGRVRYLGLFAFAGAVGGLASVADSGPEEALLPRIGASGAISGLLGAYLVTFPRTRLLMSVPFVRFVPVVLRWPVWTFLLIWVGLNLFGWLGLRGSGGPFLVDYAAHIGGFGAGLAFGAALRTQGAEEPVRAPGRLS